MVDSPVRKEAEAVLRARFEAAKEAKRIPQDCEFRMMIFPSQKKNHRIYKCVDHRNTPLSVIKPYETLITVCDRVS